MSNRKKSRWGILIGLSMLLLYVYAFFAVGIYFIWQTDLPGDAWGWVQLVFSSLAYIIAGILLFIPVLVGSLYFILRDQNIGFIGLPLLVTIAYSLLPIPVPGPIDEAIVFILSYWLRIRVQQQFPKSQQKSDYVQDDVIDVDKIN